MTDPTNLPPPLPTAASAVPLVDGDRSCIKCSYNLRGLPIAGKCPECGTPVADSLKGFLLQHASAEYRAAIGSGLSLVLNGILLMIVIMVVNVFIVVALGGGGSQTAVLITMMLGLIPTVMTYLGYLRYTEPDPGYIGLEPPNSAREVLRITLIITGTAQLIQIGLTFAGASAGKFARGGGAGAVTLLDGLTILIAVVAGIAWIVQFFCVLKYTNWLSNRVPDPFIAKRSQMYLWLLPVIYIFGAACVGLGPLIALVLYWNLLDRLRKHVKAINTTGVPAVLPNMTG